MPMTTRGRRVDYRKLAGLSTRTMKVTRKVRVKKLAPSTQGAVTQIVKQQIARNSENKMIGNNVELDILHNSPIGSADCYPLIPTISKGINSYNRIGDRLKPKGLSVKGLVSWQSESALQKDIYVRVMILSQKNIKTGSQVSSAAVDTANLLRPNSPAIPLSAFAGNTAQLNYPVNTDLFRVYMDKTIKLTGNKAGTAVESLTRQSQRWSYRMKSFPVALTFDDGNGDWVNNFAPFLAIGYAYCDGTAPDSITTRLYSSTFSALTFEDA